MISKNKKTSAGKLGDKIHSDCFIELEMQTKGGIQINLKSKVSVLYGKKIKLLLKEMSAFFGVDNMLINITDYGALDYVIMARFETALKRLMPEITKEYIPPINKKTLYKATKERLRRSRLYLPGNEPKFYSNAGLHKPDGIILDLEDSVVHTEKDAAQLLIRNALCTVNFYGAERMVRINQLPNGLNDLQYIIPYNTNLVLIPKVEHPEQIKKVDDEIKRLLKEKKSQQSVYLMPIIESALGVVNSYQIASASENICAIAVGLEDYTADIGVERTTEGTESFTARSIVVNAAKAARVQAIDTVFSDVSDMEGLHNSVIEAKSLGFEGKGCIHPRQIDVVNKAFAPTENEIERAKKIVLAFEDAERKGIGAVSLGSKMIDAPVVKRAFHTIETALNMGSIDKNWRKAE